MPFDLSIEDGPVPQGIEDVIGRVAEAAFAAEGVPRAAFSVRITTDEAIRALNRDMRGTDRVTDVLSFPEIAYPAGKTARDVPSRLRRAFLPEFGCPYLGGCALSLAQAMRQADEYGHSPEREIGYLVCHSLFHLMGYDHMEDADRARMRAMEKTAMKGARLLRGGDLLMSDEKLFSLAEEAMKNSYAPYSDFHVGACILTDTGRVFKGCNFENASYGATICAERCAASCAVAEGERRFAAIAVACDKETAWPCGICRQVLREFGGEKLRVIAGKAFSGEFEAAALGELLPRSFGPEDLGKG